jgi:hypothetical protein
MRPIPAPVAKTLIPLLLVSASALAVGHPETRPPVLFHARSARGEARLELASGARVTPPLPAGAAAFAAAALADGGWIVTGIGGDGQEIVLLTGSGSAARALPAPPASGRLRREPLPLAADGRLAGLVWLEGDAPHALAVRAARWNGAAWEAPQTVSPPGPGSQLALAATRLADGSWLLAWSAFDGHDDEILWSRLSGDGTWSAPERVAADNEVPDVTPALAATADGALLAWSRFDGVGYQVVTARFQAGRWGEPRAAAPSGSLFPSFEPATPATPAITTGFLLLYETAFPRGWAAVEIDGAGRLGRRATLAATATGTAPAERSPNDRPAVAADRSGVTFRWPDAEGAGEERAAAWERP